MTSRRHSHPAATRAIIGLSTSEMRRPERVDHIAHSEPARIELALSLTYPEAVLRAGAVPVVIPPLDVPAIEPLLDGLWGVCLSGGPDVDPGAYGAEPHPELGPTEAHLDRFEIALVRAAEARDMPVLAICRGLQVLNVARGGTLVQDLPSQRPSEVAHRQPDPGSTATHDVRIEAGSLTAACLGGCELRVNSFHHQAVDRLGRDLRAVGWAPDGVVEALEASDRTFVVGVQWHAESMVGAPEQARLMEAFADAATSYGSRAARAA
ncbi:MAG TPA: gamma-glutamyl-gamma-aminobutyrate hydrolase family protein [Solirubrobacteraceae bacterium]|jgi:putative glutamine amidotransferase|nr:gamma-glutamyl-gamma-aminobutyrate hydrolase family protein [Solirubrobacteraceae bacterium]